jgi:hypothetical protein
MLSDTTDGDPVRANGCASVILVLLGGFMFWMGSCRRDFPKSEFMPIRRRFRYASCTFSQAVSPGSACRNRGRLAALCPRFAIRPPRVAIRPPRVAIRPPRPPRVPTRPCGSYVHALRGRTDR